MKEFKYFHEARLAKNKSIQDIADKHGVGLGVIKQQLQMGTNVEKEHTDDSSEARKIAMDHLVEDPKYYSKLKKMEDH